MWVLKKWKKSKSLTELSMSDALNMEDAYLYKLSQAKVYLNKGRKIVIYLIGLGMVQSCSVDEFLSRSICTF